MPEQTIVENWPTDRNRFVCSPKQPRPKFAFGKWAHHGAISNGSCPKGCCDQYICVDCGTQWTIEAAS